MCNVYFLVENTPASNIIISQTWQASVALDYYFTEGTTPLFNYSIYVYMQEDVCDKLKNPNATAPIQPS